MIITYFFKNKRLKTLIAERAETNQNTVNVLKEEISRLKSFLDVNLPFVDTKHESFYRYNLPILDNQSLVK